MTTQNQSNKATPAQVSPPALPATTKAAPGEPSAFPMTGDEEESDLGQWQPGTAKPNMDGTYLREFDEGEATSEFHEGQWLRDGFFPSDIQDARWRGRTAPQPSPTAQEAESRTAVARCTNSDTWNCKYCRKTETCDALQGRAAAPKAAPTRTALPEGWTDCTIEFGNDGPEVVAYGPKRMMTRLAKWLGKYFAQVIAEAAPKAAPGAELPSMKVAEMVLSDCGVSTNFTQLLDRVAGRIDSLVEQRLDAFKAALEAAPKQEPSPTAGMNIAQRILHVGGRNNAAGYVEFGSIQAVEALVRQVLRDLPATAAPHKAPTESEQDLRTRFEALARDSYNFKRSRRDCYVNPATARDWKWFRLGATVAAQGGQ